jgi:hypothetical protein
MLQMHCETNYSSAELHVQPLAAPAVREVRPTGVPANAWDQFGNNNRRKAALNRDIKCAKNIDETTTWHSNKSALPRPFFQQVSEALWKNNRGGGLDNQQP